MPEVSFKSVLNELADKYMKTNQKVDENNLRKQMSDVIMNNNKTISKEIDRLNQLITQQGGQKQPLQYPMMMPMPMPMYNPQMMAQQMPSQMMPMQQQVQTGAAPVLQPSKTATQTKPKKKKGENVEEESTVTPSNEIDEALNEMEREESKKETENSIFSTPGAILGSVAEAAEGALGIKDENKGPAAGNPLKLPSGSNLMEQIGDGLGQAANTLQNPLGKEEKKKENKSFFGEMASNMVNNVKEIGKGAINTITSNNEITNKAIDMVTYKKCNPNFIGDLGGIIDTCDRDNYVEIYNIIIDKLKLKKENFRPNIKKEIDELKPIDLAKENIITPDENTLTIETAEAEAPLNIAEKTIENQIERVTKKKKKKKMKTKEGLKKSKKKKKKKVKKFRDEDLITGIQV
jgi:hypothetical protein